MSLESLVCVDNGIAVDFVEFEPKADCETPLEVWCCENVWPICRHIGR